MKWPKPSQISGRSIRVWQRNFSIYRQNWKISFVPPLLEPRLDPPPAGAAKRVNTAVPHKSLAALNTALITLPDGFTPSKKLAIKNT